MNKPFSILVQKNSGGVVDLYEEFGVACVSFPFLVGGETKEPETRDWPGEDGEDAYLPPNGLPLKPYDLEAEMVYKGQPNSTLQNILALRDFLSGADEDGAELKIYNSYTHIGRAKCYLKGMGDPEFSKSNLDDVLKFKLTFRVCDPRTLLSPKYEGGNIISLS